MSVKNRRKKSNIIDFERETGVSPPDAPVTVHNVLISLLSRKDKIKNIVVLTEEESMTEGASDYVTAYNNMTTSQLAFFILFLEQKVKWDIMT